MDPLQLLHPNPRETNEDGTAIIKEAEHKSMNKGESSIKSQRASNDPQLAQLIIAATVHVYTHTHIGLHTYTKPINIRFHIKKKPQLATEVIETRKRSIYMSILSHKFVDCGRIKQLLHVHVGYIHVNHL